MNHRIRNGNTFLKRRNQIQIVWISDFCLLHFLLSEKGETFFLIDITSNYCHLVPAGFNHGFQFLFLQWLLGKDFRFPFRVGRGDLLHRKRIADSVVDMGLAHAQAMPSISKVIFTITEPPGFMIVIWLALTNHCQRKKGVVISPC